MGLPGLGFIFPSGFPVSDDWREVAKKTEKGYACMGRIPFLSAFSGARQIAVYSGFPENYVSIVREAVIPLSASLLDGYLLRLMIEATIAASEAVDVIMPIALASPFPLRSCFIGTTICEPGSTFG